MGGQFLLVGLLHFRQGERSNSNFRRRECYYLFFICLEGPFCKFAMANEKLLNKY